MSRETRGATRADVLVVIALGALVVPTALLAQEGLKGKAEQTRCANNLRQLGLAAICYADDKRYFPHVGPLRELDGGYATSATPRVVRALVYFGYHDDPEDFVCPGSDDDWRPVPDAARQDMRRWGWAGRLNEELTTPLLGGVDPTLAETTELSYGWTRRGMTTNVRASFPLAADRAREHHAEGGGSVLMVDGTVRHEPAARFDSLAATEGEGAGHLALRGEGEAPPARQADARTREAREAARADARPKGDPEEQAAIAGLRTIASAQTMFMNLDKEGDGKLDYGTLEELASASLIALPVDRAAYRGYVFELRISPLDPMVWMATASPERPGKRHFMVDASGVVYASKEAFQVGERCAAPEGAERVPRGR